MLWLRATRSPALLFAAALLVRIYFFLTLFRLTPIQRVWDTGYEACHIAASLVAGLGFSSPFGVPTGASAWAPPVYTCMLAVVFKMFGTYSVAAAWTMLLLNALFAALTAVAILMAGESILGNGVGVIAGWTWAFLPYAVVMSMKVWETSLSALLVMAGLLLYERMRRFASLPDWAGWGLFWGFTMLVNPALGIFFPVLSVVIVWRKQKRSPLPLAVAVVVACAVVGPWVIRNQSRLHSFVPVRSNFGEELWLGNHEGVRGPNDETRHPLGDPRELAAYRRLGERDYVAEKQRAAMEFIGTHRGEFVRLTLQRIAYFWISPRGSLWGFFSALSFVGLVLAMRKDSLQALPFAVALLLFPAVYYLTHSDNWYRHPIEPLMILLVGNVVVSLGRQVRRTGLLPRSVSSNGGARNPAIPLHTQDFVC